MPGVVLPWNAAIHKRFDTIEVDFCLTGGRAEDMVEGEPFLFHMTEGDLLSIERERDALVAILEDLFVQQRAGTHCHADHPMIICQCRGRRKYITRHGHSLLDLYSLSFFFPSSFFLAPSSFFLPSCFLLSSFFLLPSFFFLLCSFFFLSSPRVQRLEGGGGEEKRAKRRARWMASLWWINLVPVGENVKP